MTRVQILQVRQATPLSRQGYDICNDSCAATSRPGETRCSGWRPVLRRWHGSPGKWLNRRSAIGIRTIHIRRDSHTESDSQQPNPSPAIGIRTDRVPEGHTESNGLGGPHRAAATFTAGITGRSPVITGIPPDISRNISPLGQFVYHGNQALPARPPANTLSHKKAAEPVTTARIENILDENCSLRAV